MTNPSPPTVDYAPPARPAPRRPKAFRIGRAALLALPACFLTLSLLRPSGFGYWQVCTTCGEIETVTEWRLPLTGITYHTTHRAQPTALSREIAQSHIRPSHPHRWEFGSGNDFGFTRSCALGEAHVLLNVVDRPYVAKFIGQLSRNADPATVDQWLDLLLDPKTARNAEMAIPLNGFPDNGFATDRDFEAWWKKHRQEMLNDAHDTP